MDESPSSSSSSAEFLAHLERLLTPVYAECFSDETRRVRNLLLVISSTLILFSFGVVTMGESVKLPLLPLSLSVKTGMRWVLMSLCFYFVLLFATRSYTEWQLWRLRNRASSRGLLDLRNKSFDSWQRSINQARQAFANLAEDSGNKEDVSQEPAAASPLELKLAEYSRKMDQSYSEIKKIGPVNPEQPMGRLNELHGDFEEAFASYLEVVDRFSEEWKARSEADRKELEVWSQQVTDAVQGLSEIEIPKKELKDLNDIAKPIPVIMKIRFHFELLFPILYGTLAMIFGLAIHRTG